MDIKLNQVFAALLIISFCSTAQLSAQLFIDTSYTVEEMVMDFFDNSCVSPSNISYTGTPGTYAFFDAGNTDLNVDAGIYLGSGFAVGAIGPNDNGGFSGITGGAGDTDLDNISGGLPTNDAAVLEMDIEATGSQLDFSYVFASEEYLEFVNTGFNDIFAFFVSGPGISGLENIAMVPNSADPVSINTINNLTNSEFFINNAGGMDIQFDGYTTELTASVNVIPNETYHVKIVIADVGDFVFDSGIFLGVQSLCGDSLLVPKATYEIFVNDFEVDVENFSRYASSYYWDFGDNTTSTDKNPSKHIYAEDGTYEIMLVTQNYCCNDTLIKEVVIGNSTTVHELEDKPYRFSPNPVQDRLWIEMEAIKEFELRMFTISGKQVLYQAGQGSIEVNLSDLDAGLYLMEWNDGNRRFRERILKK